MQLETVLRKKRITRHFGLVNKDVIFLDFGMFVVLSVSKHLSFAVISFLTLNKYAHLYLILNV